MTALRTAICDSVDTGNSYNSTTATKSRVTWML